jgi:transcriptional regulator PpsR
LNTRGTDDPTLGTLAELAPQLAETFVTVATDIALVVDLDGTIRSVAVGADSSTPTASSWVGRPWVDTVTAPTRRKIERLLGEVAIGGVSRRCEVDHLLPSGASVPVAYAAVRLGRAGPVLAAGRDLTAVAAIQQRFVQAQQQMERDYWRHRESESRYRRAFQAGPDAVLVIDAASLRIVEANPIAVERLGLAPDAIAGRDALAGFDAASRAALEALCSRAGAGRGAAERGAEPRVRLSGSSAEFDAAVAPLREGDADRVLLRLREVVRDRGAPDGEAHASRRDASSIRAPSSA